MRAPAERVLLVIAGLCMAGAAVGLYVQRAPKSDTTAVQQTATQGTTPNEQDEEPRRYPLPAGPRKYQ